MGPETVATLAIVAVIVLALAAYVFLIALGLRRLSFTLGTIIVGLRAIKEQTRPANAVLSGILTDVSGIEGDLVGVLEAVGEALGEPAAEAPPEAAPPAPPAPERAAQARTAPPRLPEGPADDGANGQDAPEERVPVGTGARMSAAVSAARSRLRR